MMKTKMNNKKQKSLLQAMECVVELSKDSKLSKEFFRKAKSEIKLHYLIVIEK